MFRVFIGDAHIVGVGLLRLMSDGSEAPKEVVSSVRSVMVGDGSAVYHRIYAGVPVVVDGGVEVVPVRDVVEAARPIPGGVCAALRAAAAPAKVRGQDCVIPRAIVAYSSGWFENVSTAPARVVLSARPMEWYGVVVFAVQRDPGFVRPAAARIAERPTTVVLGRQCSVSFSPAGGGGQASERRGSLIGSLLRGRR